MSFRHDHSWGASPTAGQLGVAADGSSTPLLNAISLGGPGRHMVVDWEEIERAWLQSVTDAIVVTVASNPTERFYAGAFWLLYGDSSSLHAPVFGLNSESSAPGIRWHPPDWRWSVIDEAHERVRPLYQPLVALEVDETTYESLWERHIEMLAKVSRQVTTLVRSNQIAGNHSAFSPHFFVGIIDFSQGDVAIDYLKRSVDEGTIAASGILEGET